MAGPWEKYGELPAPQGPWTKYAAGDTPAAMSEKPGMGTSLVRGAAQGLTLGLADESYGLTQGLRSLMTGGTFSEGYDRGVAEYRGRDKAAKEANPITSTVGEIAGGMGTGLGLARSGATLIRGGMSLPQAVGRGAIEGAGYGAAYGAGTAEGGLPERAQGAIEGAGIGAGVGGAVPVVARGIGAAAGRVITPMTTSPERQAAAAILEREGVPLTAGQRTGGKALRYMEGFFGDAPGAGGQASAALEAQGEAFTDAAMRRAGAGGRATSDNLRTNRDRIGQQFNDLAGRNTVTADRQFATELGLALREYDRVLPAEQRRIVGELASEIVERFQAGGGNMAGRDYQTIRSRLSRMAQNARVNDPEFAQAIRTMRDGLDNNMGRSISPDDAAAWQTARREWGNQKTLERAAAAGGEDAAGGLISPAQLRIAASQGGGNRAAYARGEGDFGELARAGNMLMTPLPNSGTAQRGLSLSQAGGVFGGASGAVDPLYAGVMALGPAAAGRILMSPWAQAYFSNRAMTPAARTAIEARLRSAIQGAAGSQSPRLSPPFP